MYYIISTQIRKPIFCTFGGYFAYIFIDFSAQIRYNGGKGGAVI